MTPLFAMPGRPKINAAAPFRSSVADAAFAVEERVVWGGADLLRGVGDAVRWPIERLIWALERSVVWPLEERADGWGAPARAAGATALALLAAAAGVLGLIWASGSGSAGAVREASAPAPAVAPATRPEPVAPVLHGPAPNFKAIGDGASKVEVASSKGAAEATASSAAKANAAKPGLSTTGTAAPVVPAGPAATAVAHRFATAFVLYEIGKDSPKVRVAFVATATPRLVHALLRRPPRLPVNVKVPKAKVLNIVPGPKRGDAYTMSVSLLRLGVASELRIALQQDKRTHEWHVQEILA